MTAEHALAILKVAVYDAVAFRIVLEANGGENGTSQWSIAVTVPTRDHLGHIVKYGPTLVEVVAVSGTLENAVRDSIRACYFQRTGQQLPSP